MRKVYGSTDLAVSIDLGGTKCAAALIGPEGEIRSRRKIIYGDAGGDAVGTAIVDLAKELMTDAVRGRSQVRGIGISVPGISDTDKGTVWAPNIPGWEDYPLRKLVKEQVAGKDIPVWIDSDRACSILGEVWLGAARGSANAIFIAVGTGIGAGIMVDGHLIRGLHEIAGAIGWMALDRPYREKYKKYGNFEYYASGNGLVRAAGELTGREPSELIRNDNIKKLTAEDLFEAYSRKDRIAVKVIRQAVEYWGMASANLVSLFNPEKIIFGGGVFGPATSLIGEIYREASRWAQPVAIKQADFLASRLKGEAPLYGAAYQVFRH